MVTAGHTPVHLSSRPSATYQVLLTEMPVLWYILFAKTFDTNKLLDLIWMKILNSDSQYVFSIILVEKLGFVRPNWNILVEITYESKLT